MPYGTEQTPPWTCAYLGTSYMTKIGQQIGWGKSLTNETSPVGYPYVKKN